MCEEPRAGDATSPRLCRRCGRSLRADEGAGATVVAEPEDQPYGDRRYDAEDLEGVRWTFAQHIRDVPADEWGATQP